MAKYRDPRVRVARPYAGTRRQMRTPSHPFQLRYKPFQIQPFLLSPVLPGETMKNLVLQSRVVTKPIVNPLLGWWTEYMFFYVKLKDIQAHIEGPHMTGFVDEMVTDPAGYNPATLRSAADRKYNHPGGTNWAKYCLQVVTEYYFRDQGEDWDASGLVDGMPLAQYAGKNWMDSLTLETDKRLDRDTDMDLNNDGNIGVQESLDAMAIWQAQRDAGLESLDYEDWLRTFGVAAPEEVPESFNRFRPELLRSFREWAYPTNTVEPTTGVPSSAVSWVIGKSADKDRRFLEPGFIFGVTVSKPKIYVKDTSGGLASYLETLENWLPALSHANYEKGFINFGGTSGPLASKFGTGPGYTGYWLDLRDLFVYGDQFVNFAPDAAGGAISVVKGTGGTRYPLAADINALFTGADKYIQCDGIVNLAIAGRQADHTPGRKVL